MTISNRSASAMTPKQVLPDPPQSRLRLSHVRSVFRLLFEVRDLGGSPLGWRRHLVDGLVRLVDGATAIAAEAVIPPKPRSPRLLGTVIGGVSDQRLVSVYRALVERGGYAFGLRKDDWAGRTNTTITSARQQMAEGRAWHHRPDLDPWRTLDCEYFICSKRALPGCVHLIILTRTARARPFNELERRIVALFHAELGRLWRCTGDDPATNLPPQLHRTLELLLEGASEGEIVAKLALSPHTVHDHVKRLYRRFEVNSRAQLLARLSHSPLVRAPRLCVNLLRGDDDARFDSVDLTRVASG